MYPLKQFIHKKGEKPRRHLRCMRGGFAVLGGDIESLKAHDVRAGGQAPTVSQGVELPSRVGTPDIQDVESKQGRLLAVRVEAQLAATGLVVTEDLPEHAGSGIRDIQAFCVDLGAPLRLEQGEKSDALRDPPAHREESWLRAGWSSQFQR